MLYFILGVIIFVAHLFPEPPVQPIVQQKGGLEKELRDARGECHGDTKAVSESSTPKHTGSKTTTDQVPGEKGTQTQEDASENGRPSGSLSSQATLINTPTETLPPSLVKHEYGEEAIKPKEYLSEATAFSMEMMALFDRALDQVRFQGVDEERTAINGLDDCEQVEIRSPDLCPEVQNSGNSTSLEETESVLQNVGGNIGAAETGPMVQEELLRTEEAAHQQTREELVRLRDWCERLEDHNTRLQTQADDAGRENTKIQRQLNNAEDKLTRFQAHAEGQIRKLMKSIMEHRSMIERLRKAVIDLNTGVSWYFQLGINFYTRLQKAERSLKPYGRLFAEYQSLLSDAAQYFSFPADTGNGNGSIHDNFVRVEEIDEDSHNEEKEEGQGNGSASMLDADMGTCDHTSATEAGATEAGATEAGATEAGATEAGATEAEDGVTALDDEDEDDFPSFDRPMRPGTANRVPISVFAARSANPPKKPSSPLSENSTPQTQQAPSPATSTFPLNFGFSKSSVKPEEKGGTTVGQEPTQESANHTEAPNTSTRSRYGRGGIDRGRGRRGPGTNSRRVPHRGGGGSPLVNSMADPNAGIGPSPAGTAFPINSGFSEP